jgi:hypothetical protein
MNAVPWFERIIPPMPQPSYDEFWTLLVKSGLVDAGAVATLRREHAADPAAGSGSTAKDAAAWLGRRGLLTRWQAKRLAIGNLGPFFLGDYRLLERHDREGNALLFTARHEPSGRIVSLVLLNAKRCRRIDVWTEIVQRTTAASEATDPMLSRTWSLEQHESSRIIICEHIEGTSLAAELDQHGPLPAVQAGVLVSQIARAVADLHGRGSVHGGLSTDVLLREPSPGGVPRTGRVRLLQFPQVGDPQRIPLRPWNTEAELDQLGVPAEVPEQTFIREQTSIRVQTPPVHASADHGAHLSPQVPEQTFIRVEDAYYKPSTAAAQSPSAFGSPYEGALFGYKPLLFPWTPAAALIGFFAGAIFFGPPVPSG